MTEQVLITSQTMVMYVRLISDNWPNLIWKLCYCIGTHVVSIYVIQQSA